MLHLIKYEFKDCCVDFSIYKLIAGQNQMLKIIAVLHHLNIKCHHPHTYHLIIFLFYLFIY